MLVRQVRPLSDTSEAARSAGGAGSADAAPTEKARSALTSAAAPNTETARWVFFNPRETLLTDASSVAPICGLGRAGRSTGCPPSPTPTREHEAGRVVGVSPNVNEQTECLPPKGGSERSELTVPVVDRFLGSRRRAGYRRWLSTRSLGPLLDCLREVGVAPAWGHRWWKARWRRCSVPTAATCSGNATSRGRRRHGVGDMVQLHRDSAD